MSKTENVELTVLCLIEDGDKILLQNRVKAATSCLQTARRSRRHLTDSWLLPTPPSFGG